MRKVLVALLVVGLPAAALGEITFFDNEQGFVDFNKSEDKIIKGFETFEENTFLGSIIGFADILESGVPHTGFPSGMTGVTNMIVQANMNTNPGNPDPRGGDLALVHVSAAAGFGNAGDIVLANYFLDSLDLIFTTDDITGVGMELTALLGGNSVRVDVYFTDLTTLLGSTDSAGATDSFVGIWSDNPIGRINLFDLGGGAQGADNIQLWVGGGDACAGFLCADTNCDGEVDAADIDPFFLALGNPADYEAQFPDCSAACTADVNGDTEVDAADIDPFFEAIGAGECP